jgi:uncharacterized protein YciW
MEQRRVSGKSHWYHETQSSARQAQVLPLVPEAATVDDPFLLNLTLPDWLIQMCGNWLTPARTLYKFLFPQRVAVNRLHTFSAYDRLSTALTVAQVYGVQRLCNHYAARLAPFPAPTRLVRAIAAWHKSRNMPASLRCHPGLSTPAPAVSLMKWG